MNSAAAVGLAIALFVLLMLWLTAPGKACARALRWRGQAFAHRGLHGGKIAENSLSAFEAACAAGYGIELDVRFSRDGCLVVFHDDDLMRMCQDPRPPEALTLAQLKQMSLRGTSDTIPTLDEVLACVHGRVPLLVEIKSCKNIFALTDKVCTRLLDYPGAFLVESFNPLCLMRLRQRYPQILRGQLVASVEETMGKSGKALALPLSGLLTNVLSRPDFVAYNIADLKSPSPYIQRRLYRTPMAAWTVRSSEQLRLAKSRGDMVIFEEIRP